MKWLGRFLSGDVELCVVGRDAERFFALCASNGIDVGKLTRAGQDEYICHMTKRDVWDSRPYYRKAKVHCRIIRKRGMPFLMFRYRKRILFPLALCAVMYLLGYCSQFIWKIEINGNSYLTDESVINYLEEINASYGTKKSDIDCNGIELMLREDFNEVIWASVAIEGTNLVIELQEKTTPADDDNSITVTGGISDFDSKDDSDTDGANSRDIVYSPDAAGAYTIVADTEASIVSIVTRTGLAEVAAGDLVSAGDVLVRGTQTVAGDDGETKFLYVAIPDADIIGRVIYEYNDVIPVEAISKSYADKALSGIYIQLPFGRFEINLPDFTQFGRFEINLPEFSQLWGVTDGAEGTDNSESIDSTECMDNSESTDGADSAGSADNSGSTDGADSEEDADNADILESYHQAHLTDNFYLPFGIGLKWVIAVEEDTYTRTDEEALSAAEANLQKYLEGLEEDGVVILSKNVTIHKEGNEYVVEGEITVEQSIGVIAPDEESLLE